MNTHHFPQTSEAEYQATTHLNHLLKKHYNKPLLLLLSGGSALRLLHDVHTEYLSASATITMLDERYSKDHEVNNFSQMTHLPFYKIASLRGSRFIDTRVQEDASQELLAVHLENELRKWFYANEGQGVSIAIMGIGSDAHTAGIMPYPEDVTVFEQLFENELKWVIAYNAKDKHEIALRITTTMPFLRKIDHTIVFVTSESKRTALEKIFASSDSLNHAPARIMHEMKDVNLFTDITL